MFKWLAIIAATLRSTLRRQRDLAVENLVLRQQLAILKQRNPRPRLTDTDRLFWVMFSRVWPGWREALHIVKPETVVRWHRQGYRYYWRWKSRHRGRPKVDPEIRGLIRRMCRANPLWGAPRIHGELLKLGIEVSETTVSKYIIRHRKPPCQTWRTFLQNHAEELIALDFFNVSTATFRVWFVLVILSHDRRRIRRIEASTCFPLSTRYQIATTADDWAQETVLDRYSRLKAAAGLRRWFCQLCPILGLEPSDV